MPAGEQAGADEVATKRQAEAGMTTGGGTAGVLSQQMSIRLGEGLTIMF